MPLVLQLQLVRQLLYLVLQAGHLTSSRAACRLQPPLALLYFTCPGSQLVVQVLDGGLGQGLHLHPAPKQHDINSYQGNWWPSPFGVVGAACPLVSYQCWGATLQFDVGR